MYTYVYALLRLQYHSSLTLPVSLSPQSFVAEVKSHEDQIEAVKGKGAALKSQGTPEDKKMVDRWVGDLLKRYDDLNFTLEEKKVNPVTTTL